MLVFPDNNKKLRPSADNEYSPLPFSSTLFAANDAINTYPSSDNTYYAESNLLDDHSLSMVFEAVDVDIVEYLKDLNSDSSSVCSSVAMTEPSHFFAFPAPQFSENVHEDFPSLHRAYLSGLTNITVTKRLLQEDRDQLMTFVNETILPGPTGQLFNASFLNTLVKAANMRCKDRHLSKEIEGQLLMVAVSEFFHRHTLRNEDGKEYYTSERFQSLYPDIYERAKSYRIDLEVLICSEKVFHVATKVMGINPSRKKSALLVAANLISDPTKPMTTGSKQVVRTSLVLALFSMVTDVKAVKRQRSISTKAQENSIKNKNKGSKKRKNNCDCFWVSDDEEYISFSSDSE